MEKFTNFGSEARCEKNLFVYCKGKLFRLDESFVSHYTKRWKLFKRIKVVCLIESKDESLKQKQF